MGRFSTTVHIKNNADRMRFVNTFCDVMKKRGFTPCAEDEAAQSYLLAFGEGWITLANEDYKDNPKKSSDDVREMSAALKTSAFSVEVVDSDFAMMTLCTPNGKEDRVVVGDGSGYDVPEMTGDRKLWESLLTDGKTWEQFSEAAAAREVFVEDALGKVAAVLGIDPYYMDADHNEVSEKAEGNNNITAFYFKKAAEKSKSMSLNAAFKKVFGEALEPLGFKLIKSKYPYFVRVVPGGEVIHVITIVSEQGFLRNEKAFKISGGAATIYRGKIDLSINPRNSNWLIDIADAYLKTHSNDRTSEKLYRFTYAANDCCSMTEELVVALGYTKQFLLPVLDNVTILSECADFYWQFHPMLLTIYYEKDWGMSKELGQSEGLMLFKIYDTRDYEAKSMEKIRQFKAEMLCAMREGRIGYTPETLDSDCKRSEEQTKIDVTDFDEHLNHPQHNADILNELNRRKAANAEILRSYGLDI